MGRGVTSSSTTIGQQRYFSGRAPEHEGVNPLMCRWISRKRRAVMRGVKIECLRFAVILIRSIRESQRGQATPGRDGPRLAAAAPHDPPFVSR